MLLESPYGWPLMLAGAGLIAVTLFWGWRGHWRRAWQLVLGAVLVAILLAAWAIAGDDSDAPVTTILPFILIAYAAGILFSAAAAALILSAFAITAKVTDEDPRDQEPGRGWDLRRKGCGESEGGWMPDEDSNLD